MNDDKLEKILELQNEGRTRSEIADLLYNGKHKSNMKSLNKFMKRRDYIVVDDKFIKEDDSPKEAQNIEIDKKKRKMTVVIKRMTNHL
ncbi:hypothetical protein ACFIJ5_18830 (plasmid) [Haloimpatiens sp. FM7330]|uniref:hypothetical protein n=1 Tax=Haloimpatiens sp. FM7330 TaxID=3298610 RepID=UPI00363DC96F